MSWAWLAIGFGALIIVTRLPLIVRPSETLELYRGLWATDARARGFSVLYVMLGVACFLVARETSGTPHQILVALTLALGAIAVWLLAAPAHFRGVIDRILSMVEASIDAAAMRVIASLAVALGAGLVWLGVRAL
jgi:hypothetical protein